MYELLKDLTIMMLEEGLDETSIHRVLDIVEGDLIDASSRFKPKNNVIDGNEKFAKKREEDAKKPKLKYVKKNKIEAKKPISKAKIYDRKKEFKEFGKRPTDPNTKGATDKDIIKQGEVDSARDMKDSTMGIIKMMKSGELDKTKQTQDGRHLVGDVNTVRKAEGLRDKATEASLKYDFHKFKRTGVDPGYSKIG